MTASTLVMRTPSHRIASGLLTIKPGLTQALHEQHCNSRPAALDIPSLLPVSLRSLVARETSLPRIMRG